MFSPSDFVNKGRLPIRLYLLDVSFITNRINRNLGRQVEGMYTVVRTNVVYCQLITLGSWARLVKEKDSSRLLLVLKISHIGSEVAFSSGTQSIDKVDFTFLIKSFRLRN